MTAAFDASSPQKIIIHTNTNIDEKANTNTGQGQIQKDGGE